MIDIFPMGKNELAPLDFSFVSVRVPAFPVYDKTYLMRTFWFLSPEMIVEQCSNIDPFIVFDHTGVYEETKVQMKESVLPKEIVQQGTGYFIRACIEVPKDKFQIIVNNVIEVENVNYNYEWDFEHYSDDKLQERLQKKAEKEAAIQKENEEVLLGRDKG